MSVSLALETLSKAKQKRHDWRDVAKTIRDVKTSLQWQERFETPMAWFEAAADVSGYSVGMLRRMVSVTDFLERIKDEVEDFDALNEVAEQPPFAATEVLKRLYDIDPDKARTLLPAVMLGKIAYRDVKEIYQGRLSQADGADMRPGPVWQTMSRFGAEASKNFSVNAFEAVKRHQVELTGNAAAKLCFREYKFPYATVDAVAISVSGATVEWVDGFMFRYLSGDMRGFKLKSLLSDVALAASFFRRFWLIIPKGPDEVPPIVEDILNLELHSVGVAEFDRDGDIPLIIHQAPELPPTPDRQRIALATVMQQGISGLSLV